MSVVLRDKTVAVVGLGLTGNACVRFLLAQGATVLGFDTRTHLKPELDIDIQLGDLDAQRLQSADLVVISPGVDPRHPALVASRESGIEQIGDVELFARFNQRPVIAVTGSNGKSTVATLIADMCSAGGMHTLLGGNIGTPVLELLDKPGDIIVLELSSFQLETLSSLRPKVACMLNLCDDHLDRHGSLAAYREAKLRIFMGSENQIVNRQDKQTWPTDWKAENSFGLDISDKGWSWDERTQQVIYNGKEAVNFALCLLSGDHNVMNVQAAAACAHAAGIDIPAIEEAAKRFAGLPHRFEIVSKHDDVVWINDSKATNAGAAIAAVESARHQCDGQVILIAGGDAKGADLSVMREVLHEQVDHLITLGKDGPMLASLKVGTKQVESMAQAVSTARQMSRPGDVVLLSPACASLDMYQNYQQRGEDFCQAVRGLAA